MHHVRPLRTRISFRDIANSRYGRRLAEDTACAWVGGGLHANGKYSKGPSSRNWTAFDVPIIEDACTFRAGIAYRPCQ